jgi:hypothetical protein
VSEELPTVLCEALKESLCRSGLDITHPFAARQEFDSIFPLERFGRHSAQAVLVGNTRALWPHLVDWASQHPDEPHPVERYVSSILPQAMNASCATLDVPLPRQQVYLSHRLDYAGPSGLSAVPFQRLAEAVGFAALGPAHLSAHPGFGPWFAFRALLVLDLPGRSPAAGPARSPCANCTAPCRDALRAVPEAARRNPRVHWEHWLAVRDACPVGGDHRYGEPQLKYHYSKARQWLTCEIAEDHSD